MELIKNDNEFVNLKLCSFDQNCHHEPTAQKTRKKPKGAITITNKLKYPLYSLLTNKIEFINYQRPGISYQEQLKQTYEKVTIVKHDNDINKLKGAFISGVVKKLKGCNLMILLPTKIAIKRYKSDIKTNLDDGFQNKLSAAICCQKTLALNSSRFTFFYRNYINAFWVLQN